MTAHGKKNKSRKPFFTLIIITLVFLIPLLLAWYYFANQSAPTRNTVNRGQLINPPVATKTLQLTQEFRGRWTLILFSPEACNKTCQVKLHHLRQIWKATGKEQNRIKRALLMYRDSANVDNVKKMLQKSFPKTQELIIDKRIFIHALKQYAQAGTVFVVDPMGNVMMRYQPSTAPRAIFKDLSRLLKVSQIG